MRTNMATFQTDLPSRPFPLVRPEDATRTLAFEGGPAVIAAADRATRYPVTEAADLFGLLQACRQEPDAVVEQFEQEYRRYLAAGAVLATSSGTAGLQLALVGAGVQPGDEVLVPALTFIATAQAVVAAGAVPVFVDIDPRTFCMDADAARSAVGERTKAVMPVHTHGLPADLDALVALCRDRNLLLIEDASHAHSATHRGRLCGAIGDAAGQSLMADKNFPVGGEGGVAIFAAPDARERARDYCERHGLDFRMSWIAAQYGTTQLARLPYYDAVRARNAARLQEALAANPLFTPPFVPRGCVHAYNMFRITLTPDQVGLGDLPVHRVKGAVQELLQAEGVLAREWQNCPIPAHAPFRNRRGFGDGYPFTLSKRDYAEAYALEHFPATLRVLESTLVLCRDLRAPISLERVDAYAVAFEKVARRSDAIRKLAEANPYPLPYRRDARLG